MDRKRQNRILLALVLLAAVPLVFLEYLPLQDLPHWTLEATVLDHLDDPAVAADFSLQKLPVPNCLGTLLMASAGHWIGAPAAARLVAFLCLLLFPFGFVYLRRVDGRMVPRLEIFGMLFAANHFFMMGYFNFCLGLALAFFAIGFFQKRAAQFSWTSTIVLGFLLIFVYLAHFLAFFIAATAVAAIARRTHGENIKGYITPALAFIPAMILLVVYAIGHRGSFAVGFAYSPLKYLWYKAAPFAALSNFYPVTPTILAWVNVMINGLILVGLGALVVGLLVKKTATLRSPLTIAALALLVLGLVAPTRFFELVRPGQRLIFGAFFLFLAGVDAPRSLRKEVRPWLFLLLAALVGIQAVNFFVAGKRVDRAVDILMKHLPEGAAVLQINDSHFDMNQSETMLTKTVDPYSYPVWVAPLKALRHYPAARLDGLHSGVLFSTGLTRSHRKRLIAINSLEQLASPSCTNEYSHVILTGTRAHMDTLLEATYHSFQPIRYDVNFALLARRPEVSPMILSAPLEPHMTAPQ